MKDSKLTNKRTRRRPGIAAAAILLSCCATSAVAAFSAPTMKADLFRRSSNLRNSEIEKSTRRRGQGIPAGSPLEMICKDQHDFEMQVGHAMDVLRQDYPCILSENPDYSIYDDNLELIDPTGVRLLGVNNYKAAFRLLHAVVGIFYCPERSGLTFRMCYDKARQNIRIHWNAQVIPKAIFGGYKTTLHVDGISVYELSKNSGNITQHRIEQLVINDNTFMPEQGIFAALRGYAVKSDVDSIPVFNVDSIPLFNVDSIPIFTLEGSRVQREAKHENEVLQFQNFSPISRSILFSNNGDEKRVRSSQLSSVSSNAFDNLDWEALEKKNMARKKFGLDPLTPEEFIDLQEQVAELDSQQQKRAATTAAEMAKKKQQEEGGFLKKLFGKALENTCEENWDCERPEVCCDFGFKKMCCTSGMRVLDGPQSRQGQLAEVPVIANPNPYPPQDPRRRNPF